MDTHTMVEELRKRGMAVCVFSAEDIDTSEGTEEQRASFILRYRKRIEEAMVTAGNASIDMWLEYGEMK